MTIVTVLTLSVLSSSFSWVCSTHFPLEAESHLRTTTSRSPPLSDATCGTSIKTGPRNLDPRGPSCNILQASPARENYLHSKIPREIHELSYLRPRSKLGDRAARFPLCIGTLFALVEAPFWGVLSPKKIKYSNR